MNIVKQNMLVISINLMESVLNLQPCLVLSKTAMHCPTPEISLPPGISKRDIYRFSNVRALHLILMEWAYESRICNTYI